MSLTQSSQTKQIVGIILSVVFLLCLFVYGTKGYRSCRYTSALKGPKGSAEAQICKAEDGSCPVEIKSVQ